jgi:hypothetical protein
MGISIDISGPTNLPAKNPRKFLDKVIDAALDEIISESTYEHTLAKVAGLHLVAGWLTDVDEPGPIFFLRPADPLDEELYRWFPIAEVLEETAREVPTGTKSDLPKILELCDALEAGARRIRDAAAAMDWARGG